MRIKLSILSLGICVGQFATANTPKPEEKFQEIKKAMTESVTQAQNSQKKVDAYSDETTKLLGQYQQITQQIEDTKIYNQKMQEMIHSQHQEMKVIEQDIENIKQVSTQVTPLTSKMWVALNQLVERDLPFLKKERTERVARLKKLMAQSSVSLSEKYRKVLEAFQIEMSYGNSLNSYRGALSQGEKNFTVDYLNLGRLGFYYLSLDQRTGGIWNKKDQTWSALSRSDRNYVKTALAMAQKKVAPQITPLPITTHFIGDK